MRRTRLQTVAPDLDHAITVASDTRAREAAWAVAKYAVERVGLLHDAISNALGRQGFVTISEFVSELDKQYFELTEDANSSEAFVLAAFAKARAAHAVDFAGRGEPGEAIYEAIIATDDLSSVRSVVAASLTIN